MFFLEFCGEPIPRKYLPNDNQGVVFMSALLVLKGSMGF